MVKCDNLICMHPLTGICSHYLEQGDISSKRSANDFALKAIFSASFLRISSVIFSGFRVFFGFLFFGFLSCSKASEAFGIAPPKSNY